MLNVVTCLLLATQVDHSPWDGEYADASGMRIALAHKAGTHYLHGTSDKFFHVLGHVKERTLEMFGQTGELQQDGRTLLWSNGDNWTKTMMHETDGHCAPMTCFSACTSSNKKLVGLLQDRRTGCIDFSPGVPAGVVKGPCAPAHPECPAGQVVHDRRCVPKKEDFQKSKDWDLFTFRQKLIAAFAQRAQPNNAHCASPRIAIVGLWDYAADRNYHFGNQSSIREFYALCVATLTWEVPLSIARYPAAGSSWTERPIAVPDAYFLMTKGYRFASIFFSKAGINVSKAAIEEAGALAPWAEKQKTVVWRGTVLSDVSGDRKRLVARASASVERGIFRSDEVNVHFSEKFFERSNETTHAAHMDIADMIRSRGIFSVDGIGNEWTLPWKLMSNSVTLLMESVRVWEWYYPKLLPWKHYVPVKNDLSDFEEKVAYVLNTKHDKELRAIADASTKLVAEMEWDGAADDLRRALEQSFACAAKTAD